MKKKNISQKYLYATDISERRLLRITDETALVPESKLHKIGTYIQELPFYNVRNNRAEVMIAPELDEVFSNAVNLFNLEKTILVDDYSKIMAEEKSANRQDSKFSWTAYYDVDGIYDYLKNMSTVYSNWTELVVGGQSYEGRQLLGLKINTPTETDKIKSIIFIESGIHAREWITPATTTYFINQLLTSSDPAITTLRDRFEWQIFPTVNPDGYHYTHTRDRMWRKTRSKSSLFCHGADPNRNWDYNWGQYGISTNPCNYQTYAGSQPFSEIETRTFSEYISNLDNILAYIAFHSDAQMLLVPYSDSVEHTGNYDDLIKIGNTSLEYGEKVNGEKYDGPATAAEILYKASGGSMDWVRNQLATPIVYTYELRGTYFHWPPSRIFEQGDEVTQMMVGLFTEACNLGYC
ncbi:zinc carboxypeptidase-like isoform X2 [Plodia interpunctella]|uniref:zinc carboxypeptidase-like isoform X2 n=1 Tax=Plodia interpunctella TaxID=58824 RepID=UPI002368E6DE|nr:zinc carboxypeptidase-like isoform X2 [Plodia interpunctella]